MVPLHRPLQGTQGTAFHHPVVHRGQNRTQPIERSLSSDCEQWLHWRLNDTLANLVIHSRRVRIGYAKIYDIHGRQRIPNSLEPMTGWVGQISEQCNLPLC